jgi:predicted AAA+ superfamily ATPase
VRYAAADQFLPPGPEWVRSHWDLARKDAKEGPALLILDEVQKVRGWAETVKAEWDADRAARRGPKVVLLGSSALLLAKGVTESLAGRFFLHRCTHWSWPEMRAAFGWDLDRWLWLGGYPGAAAFADDETAWKAYVRDSLIEAVLARDVLSLQVVAKPALLRQLFALACGYPAQVLSYNKMLGQLQEAGNTTTLAHYLDLLGTAFLAGGLEPHSAGEVRSRGGSPKLVLWNNALVAAMDLRPMAEARRDHEWWGRVVENAVGGHLLNLLQGLPYRVRYWRRRDDEVDFVVEAGTAVTAVEVKTSRPRRRSGLAAFLGAHPRARPLIVGHGGMPLAEFFATDPREWA